MLTPFDPTLPFGQKDLLCLQDYTPAQIEQILSLALDIKAKQKRGIPFKPLEGKTLAMIFAKSSTRTRVSFEVGAHQLGAHPLFLSTADIQLGRGETIHDTAKVLGRMVDGIMIRTFAQADVEQLAEHGGIPVINGLTDMYHPCQALADILTAYEHKGKLKGLKLAFIGDGNNVAHSLLIICSKLGMDVAIGHPKGYAPDKLVVEFAKINREQTGHDSEILITNDPALAIKDADIVYTDVFASMGQEGESQKRLQDFAGYQVNEKLYALAHPDAIFMHCLPAHIGEEVTEGVLYGKNSVIFDEAENRLHAQKAVMAILMGDKDVLCGK